MANGARVAITGREADALEQARKFIGGDVLSLQADVLSRNSLQKMAFDVQQAFGALDIFFANAGAAYVTPVATTSEAQYDGLMDTNVRSVFFSVQAVEPVMREGGSIILNAAWLNLVGVPGRAILSASKAAVRSFCSHPFDGAAWPANSRKRRQPGVDRNADSSWCGTV
ncbi:SDR family oxidoreductase [Bradyrhizobium sp. CCBAU 051011]|uniref:SDR family oxidoreductase n=1 Tax=Bradyrhizobium sp. CCBAU 051011 TaxID=858422 RepID=UPI001FEF250E|nr:SDR family oxidoreductase [Bradyrhizobium sp. CCBAU 051011]